MIMEQDEKLTQSQQIRLAAFHMAREILPHAYNDRNRPDENARFEAAERIEKWLWKATEKVR